MIKLVNGVIRDGNNLDLKALSKVLSGLIGNGSSSNIDLNQVIGLVSGLIAGTSNPDLSKITQ